jgi:hypothetical protein
MAVITIPFDYDPQRDCESVVPICINDTDDNGETICFGWINAIVPIQDKLKALAGRVLGDVWRVSELTDLTIHHLWRKYRDNLGDNPSFRLYAIAKRMGNNLLGSHNELKCGGCYRIFKRFLRLSEFTW